MVSLLLVVCLGKIQLIARAVVAVWLSPLPNLPLGWKMRYWFLDRAVIERTHQNKSFKNVCGCCNLMPMLCYPCIDCFLNAVEAFPIDYFYFKTSSGPKCVFLLVPSVECLTLTVRNDVCVQSHVIKGRFHTQWWTCKFSLQSFKIIFLDMRSASMTCDVTVSRETDPGPIFSEILWHGKYLQI